METLIAIKPSLLNTTEQAISRFTNPLIRNCYTDDEFKFKYLNKQLGYRYSMKNCIYESLVQQSLQDCDCIPHFVSMEGEKPAWFNFSDLCFGHKLGCFYGISRDTNVLNHALDEKGGTS